MSARHDEYLFVYGTLLPELAPHALQQIVGQLEFVGSGFVRGQLYDLGEYPGAVIEKDDDGAADSQIAGRLYRLPDSIEILARLDEYEGYDYYSPNDSLFRRISCEVVPGDARMITGWIYVFNRSIRDAVLIPDGNYLNWLASKRRSENRATTDP